MKHTKVKKHSKQWTSPCEHAPKKVAHCPTGQTVDVHCNLGWKTGDLHLPRREWKKSHMAVLCWTIGQIIGLFAEWNGHLAQRWVILHYNSIPTHSTALTNAKFETLQDERLIRSHHWPDLDPRVFFISNLTSYLLGRTLSRGGGHRQSEAKFIDLENAFCLEWLRARTWLGQSYWARKSLLWKRNQHSSKTLVFHF